MECRPSEEANALMNFLPCHLFKMPYRAAMMSFDNEQTNPDIM